MEHHRVRRIVSGALGTLAGLVAALPATARQAHAKSAAA
jgi:hypothetical protein